MGLIHKFTPVLICILDNPLGDWLESTSPTNHPEGYITRGRARELEIWRMNPVNVV